MTELTAKGLLASGIALFCIFGWFPGQVSAASCPMSYNVDYGYDSDDPAHPENLPSSCAPHAVLHGNGTTSNEGLYEDAASGNYTVYFTSWLSLEGDPLATTVLLDAGTTTVNLQYNTLTYRVSANPVSHIRTNMQENIISVNSNPNTLDVSQLKGKSPIASTFPGNTKSGSYRLMQPVKFTAYLNPSVTTNTQYNIQVKSKSVLTHGSVYVYQCVNTNTFNQSVEVSGLGDYSNCPMEDSALNLTINVRSAWSTTGTTRLYSNSGGAFSLAGSGGTTTPTVSVGSQVYWNHMLNVNGTVKEPYTINSIKRVRTGGSAGFPVTSSLGSGWTFGASGMTYISPNSNLVKSVDGISSATTPYTVTSADVGKIFCEGISWSPSARAGSTTDSTEKSSTAQCFRASLGYSMTPLVNVGASVVTHGQSANFTYSIKSSGTDSYPTSWTARNIIIPPGVSIPAAFAATHDHVGCSFYTAYAGVTCSSGLSGSGVTVLSGETKTVTTEPVSVDAYPIGTNVCRVFSIWSYDESQDVAQIRDSAISCSLIAAAPYVSVIGGDVWSGGSTDAPYTSVSGQGLVTGGATQGAGFGSFSEYGVFATGQVNYFGSAARPGPSSSATGGVDGTKLTFASASGGGLSLGKFTNSHAITNLVTRYASAAHTASVLSGSTVAGSGVYRASGDVTLSGISGSPKAVIYAPGFTVTITGNLVYDTAGALTFQDLPSLTIIAKSILVDANVQEIDGNFYAVNTFVSCAQGPTSAGASAAITASGECNKQLVINGALTVVGQTATSLVLNRSYGGTKAGEAAELLRMRPEVYLTPHESSVSSFLLTTVQESELPPRY